MRLTELVWKRNAREHHMILTWPPGTPEQSVTLMHGSSVGLAAALKAVSGRGELTC